MRILWDERAWEEYLSWQTQDKKTLKKINALIKDIQRSPFEEEAAPARAMSSDLFPQPVRSNALPARAAAVRQAAVTFDNQLKEKHKHTIHRSRSSSMTHVGG